jgi:hypothetical protein
MRYMQQCAEMPVSSRSRRPPSASGRKARSVPLRHVARHSARVHIAASHRISAMKRAETKHKYDEDGKAIHKIPDATRRHLPASGSLNLHAPVYEDGEKRRYYAITPELFPDPYREGIKEAYDLDNNGRRDLYVRLRATADGWPKEAETGIMWVVTADAARVATRLRVQHYFFPARGRRVGLLVVAEQ